MFLFINKRLTHSHSLSLTEYVRKLVQLTFQVRKEGVLVG